MPTDLKFIFQALLKAFGFTAAVLATLASYLPVRRGTKINPMAMALRAE